MRIVSTTSHVGKTIGRSGMADKGLVVSIVVTIAFRSVKKSLGEMTGRASAEGVLVDAEQFSAQ